jgi:EF-hand domain pair/EF hand
MTKYLLGAAVAAAAVALSPAIAQTPQPAPHVQLQHAPMKAHTRAEVGAHVRTMFEKLDTNRDGYVTKAEAQAARGDHAGRVMKRIHKRMSRDAGGGAANRGAMFDKLDTNRDGSISRPEFESAHARRQEHRIVIREKRDGAGAPGATHEVHGMHGRRIGGMGMGLRGRMFDMADANRDGRVTLQEATAAAYRHFDTADVNRDGRITPDERMQMHQRMRTERRRG